MGVSRRELLGGTGKIFNTEDTWDHRVDPVGATFLYEDELAFDGCVIAGCMRGDVGTN